eukprot:TRINITY_DN18103_c0_g1_i1.p1 TRINITY_DN18103_c0_g1~~TRINITY_DN18103_c0_g1_i1.p1  ORF type:complete len:514 (+),score=224.68 TRINITY_DN18103_c0_g1_i1:218-1759(+)
MSGGASAEYQHSILWRGEDPTKLKFKPKYDGTKKTTRYFPGQRPAWDKDPDEEDDEPALPGEKRLDLRREPPKPKKKEEKPRGRDRTKAAVIVEDAAIGRLRRLQENQSASDGHAEKMARHREMHQARVLEELGAEGSDDEAAAEDEDKEEKGDVDTKLKGLLKPETKEEDDEEDIDIDGRGGRGPVAEVKAEADDEDVRDMQRQKARELALLRRKQEEEALKQEPGDEMPIEEEEDDEDDDEEESSSEEEDGGRVMMKPVFVSRNQRQTIKEREALEQEDELAEERKQAKVAERKAESKSLVVDQIRVEEQAEIDGIGDHDHSDLELIDDDDERNEAEEYEKWKIRELKRIKRDKEERMEREKELELIERRRRMTDAEREADDAKMDAKASSRADTKNFGFLQKYYHRGGFFQDKARTGEEPLYLRDYHEPLASEQYDKSLLPKAMQLRRGEFGKKGQVKHSHLTEVDTTDKSAAWSQADKVQLKYMERMATAKGVNNFDRPGMKSSGSRGP